MYLPLSAPNLLESASNITWLYCAAERMTIAPFTADAPPLPKSRPAAFVPCRLISPIVPIGTVLDVVKVISPSKLIFSADTSPPLVTLKLVEVIARFVPSKLT